MAPQGHKVTYFSGVKIVWKMSLTTCNDHHRSFWPNTVNSGLVFDHFSRKIPLFDVFGPANDGPRTYYCFLWVDIVYKLYLSTVDDHHRRFRPSKVNSEHILPVFSLKMTFFGLFWPGIGPKGVPRPSWWPNVGWELLYYQYQTMRCGKEWFPTKFVDRNSPKPLFWAILGLPARFSARNATLSVYSGLYNH